MSRVPARSPLRSKLKSCVCSRRFPRGPNLGPAGRRRSMPNRYYEKDGSLEHLQGRKIAIIGYGSQGHAHSLNLRDSGAEVIVGLYPGSKSWAKAEAAGLKVMTTADAAEAADTMMILVSDHLQGDLYETD